MPPKIIDLDLMEESVSVIKNHDYSTGPLYHMHAPQLMHLPMQYPKAYDDPNEDGKEKSPANNTDLRITTRNAMRFVDDIFGNITQAIKDAGQWDNTIIIFSSDNGGATYTNTANNNFPLRGAKFGAFEGGLRVPQFLSGGWIDQAQNIPSSRSFNSSTYMFVLDWAPTLLEMVGGPGTSSKYLLDSRTGPSYGNELWEYIKNSILPSSSPNKPSQLKRNVSYSLELYFDVTEETTHKMIYTGEKPVLTPRHWEATWPMDDDLIPDLGYQSVKPCRADKENPYDCCYFDLEADPAENYPIQVDCDEQLDIANMLYDNKDICWEYPSICLTGLNASDSTTDSYKLWSHYGASGPFTNSTGYPVGATDLDMLCICDGFFKGVKSFSQVDVKSFIPGIFAPFLCSDKKDKTLDPRRIECSGGFARVPQGGTLESFVAQGVPGPAMEKLLTLPLATIIPDANIAISEYLHRTGYVEWPAYAKFPFIATLNSCPLKKATLVPLPVNQFTPWLGNAPNGDPTNPTPNTTLCSFWNARVGWCPSGTNAEQNYVKSWDYGKDDPKGYFGNDALGTFDPIVGPAPVLSGECTVSCPTEPWVTAYIVPVSDEYPYGIRASSFVQPSQPSEGTDATDTVDKVAANPGEKCKNIEVKGQCNKSGCLWDKPSRSCGKPKGATLSFSNLDLEGELEEGVVWERPESSCGVSQKAAWAIVPMLMFFLSWN